MQHERLKTLHRSVRDQHPKSLAIRVHRALSWLNKAEQSDDLDSQFIFYWIAFNAAYAQHIDRSILMSERGKFQQFLTKIVSLDKEEGIAEFLWKEYANKIRVVLNNEFIFESYWDAQNGTITQEEWKQQRTKSIQASHQALASGQTNIVLSIVFSRLYTLRNQLLHGGATWNGQVNRQQLADCTAIIAKVIPLFIEVMMSNPNELWGDSIYPVIE